MTFSFSAASVLSLLLSSTVLLLNNTAALPHSLPVYLKTGNIVLGNWAVWTEMTVILSTHSSSFKHCCLTIYLFVIYQNKSQKQCIDPQQEIVGVAAAAPVRAFMKEQEYERIINSKRQNYFL